MSQHNCLQAGSIVSTVRQNIAHIEYQSILVTETKNIEPTRRSVEAMHPSKTTLSLVGNKLDQEMEPML